MNEGNVPAEWRGAISFLSLRVNPLPLLRRPPECGCVFQNCILLYALVTPTNLSIAMGLTIYQPQTGCTAQRFAPTPPSLVHPTCHLLSFLRLSLSLLPHPHGHRLPTLSLPLSPSSLLVSCQGKVNPGNCREKCLLLPSNRRNIALVKRWHQVSICLPIIYMCLFSGTRRVL